MARSTGFVVAAGAVGLADLVLVRGWNPHTGVLISAGTVAAALVAAGLDTVLPGFGTGTAVVLLVAAVMQYAPGISKNLFPTPASGITARVGGSVTV